MAVDMSESIGIEATEKRFDVEPQVADRTKQTEPVSNIQNSMIENEEGKKIDLG
jgi:hypothetical protein